MAQCSGILDEDIEEFEALFGLPLELPDGWPAWLQLVMMGHDAWSYLLYDWQLWGRVPSWKFFDWDFVGWECDTCLQWYGQRFLGCSFDRVEAQVLQMDGGEFCCQVYQSKLKSLWFNYVDADDSSFHNTDLQKASFWNSPMKEARFEGCDLRQAEFIEDYLCCARFVSCDLSGVCFKDCGLIASEFRDCKLSGATFERCDLNRARLHGCDLSGATFRRCLMTGLRAEGLLNQPGRMKIEMLLQRLIGARAARALGRGTRHG